MKVSMLTTTDNPYSPFDEWDEWFTQDVMLGHHTPSYLARVAYTSEELSEADQDLAVMNAMEEIVRDNPLGIYRIVTKEIVDVVDEEIISL